MSDIYAVVGPPPHTFFYSTAHLYEANATQGYDDFTKDQLIQSRMKLIDRITEAHYMLQDPQKQLHFLIRDAKSAFDMVSDYPTSETIKQGFSNNMTFDMRKLFRDLLKIDTGKLNALPPEKVLGYLDERYRTVGVEITFTETVEKGLLELEHLGKNAGLYDRISMLFGLLDTVGYAKDKETDKSDFARLWDANHAYFAAHLDIFLTNDRRTKKKTELVYYLLEIPTRVLSIP